MREAKEEKICTNTQWTDKSEICDQFWRNQIQLIFILRKTNIGKQTILFYVQSDYIQIKCYFCKLTMQTDSLRYQKIHKNRRITFNNNIILRRCRGKEQKLGNTKERVIEL